MFSNRWRLHSLPALRPPAFLSDPSPCLIHFPVNHLKRTACASLPHRLVLFLCHYHFHHPTLWRWFSKNTRKVKSLSRVRLFVTPWTVAYQAPPSMGFSRQECWKGLPFPSPGDLPNPGIKPRSPALQADASLSEPPPKCHILVTQHY